MGSAGVNSLFSPKSFLATGTEPLHLLFQRQTAKAVAKGIQPRCHGQPAERDLGRADGPAAGHHASGSASACYQHAIGETARVERVQLPEDLPLAIKRAALFAAALPDPMQVKTSLCQMLQAQGLHTVGAVQHLSATNLNAPNAELIGTAGLWIERLGYLLLGRVVEFTRSLYRGAAYDFTLQFTRAPQALTA